MLHFGQNTFQNGLGAAATTITLVDGPIQLSWQHCTATSEFLGEFFAFLNAADERKFNEKRHSIGYLANELLENAIKFRSAGDILVQTSLQDARFEMRVVNCVDAAVAERFKTLLDEITSRDPSELLIERMEANAADPESHASGLGLLTLMNDYDVQLGWTFEPKDSGETFQLETFAALLVY